MKRLFIVCAVLFFAVTTVMGQYYHTPYGHNRIQYRNFEWYFYSTNNFEVYYYDGGKEYALHALSYLEEEFNQLTDILGYAPYTKTKIFIYNSLQELQQSNIGVAGDVYTIGGKTDFVKLQVEIAYTGQTSEFKKEMLFKLSNVLINDMMFGGSLAEIFQNSYLLSLPNWFIEGAARYLAYGWSKEMDDYIRDYLERKQLRKLVKIDNDNAALLGQSIWNYIAIKYGQSNISNILNLTRIMRKEEVSISSTLGLSFRQFLSDWQNFYMLQQEEIIENYDSPKDEDIIAAFGQKEVVINHVKINSIGDKVAYAYHKNGRYKVKVVDLNTGKETTIVRGGYLINDQEIDFHLPLLDWQDNDNLGVLLYRRGHLYLNTYDVHSKERLQKPLQRFRQVESFSFNDNGRLAILSGDLDGQNDLFLISMRRNALKRITNDLFDDIDPVFIPGTAAIVFSSNRETDSVNVDNVKLKSVNDNYNLFLYDLDTTTHSFYRLTNTYSTDRKPFVKNQYYIYYLSDQKGITNLYRYNTLDSTFNEVSNFEHSIKDYDLSFDNENGSLAYLMLDEGRNKVYVDRDYDLNNKIFTPQTARQRMAQARFVAERYKSKNLDNQRFETLDIPEKQPVNDLTKVDSLVMPDSYFFTEEDEKEQEQKSKESGLIDTDNYVFEEDTPTNKEQYRPESFFSNYRKLEKKSRVIGPQAYIPRFSFSNLITSFAFDPIRGFSILVETEINDILENHRLTGGALTTTDLRSGDIYGEYQYLKYWMDFRVRFNRNSYIIKNLQEEDMVQRYTLNKLEVGAALPLTNSFRFEFSPLYAKADFSNLHTAYVMGNLTNNVNFAEDRTTHYVGGRSAMVLDNTIEKGFNLRHGTRALVELENYFGVNYDNQTFHRLKFDLRHYQKIHREFTLATRLFYGSSFGPAPKNFVLGGVENWMFRRFEDQGLTSPFYFSNERNNTNLLFTEFVTNLRGFNYNEMFGTDALLFNAELRLPLFKYFTRTPLSSSFLRNFQVKGFFDVGTAWTGKPPFTKEGTSFRKKYPGSPFSAEIANFQNPWLAGYGFGVQTVLLGYYVKVDVAYPVQDYEIGDTRIYLSLGLDF